MYLEIQLSGIYLRGVHGISLEDSGHMRDIAR